MTLEDYFLVTIVIALGSAIFRIYRMAKALLQLDEIGAAKIALLRSLVYKNQAREERILSKFFERTDGRVSKALLQSRMAEKLAERAYQLGSQANVTMASIAVTLQRRPLPLSREDQLKNEQIQKKLKEMFGEEQAAFMEPLLSDHDLQILDTVTDPKFKDTH